MTWIVYRECLLPRPCGEPAGEHRVSVEREAPREMVVIVCPNGEATTVSAAEFVRWREAAARRHRGDSEPRRE